MRRFFLLLLLIATSLLATFATAGNYSKIANDGSLLPLTATMGSSPKDWACSQDLDTGLIWEVKTDDGGLRDQDHTYTWYNPDSSTSNGNVGFQNGGNCSDSDCDSYAYVQAVNATGLCGANDWYLPTSNELRGVVYCSNGTPTPLPEWGGCNTVDDNYSGTYTAPTINTDLFPLTLPTSYWTSKTDFADFSEAWYVDFDYHFYGSAPGSKGYSNAVRLVRNGDVMNRPPLISTAIADQATTQTTFNESVATEVYFTVGDVDTVVDLLTLTVTSSNTTLVPNGNITIGGGGADRKVTIFPASNQSGSTTITLTVSDGYAIGESVSFLYSTVRPNPLPSMSLSDLGGKTGFRFDGAQSDSMLGQSVSGAGDINRDGFEDIIITSDNGQSAYVVFGKEGILEITSDLSTLNGSDGFRLMLDDDGNINDSILVASSIGDINGDNYDDLGLGIRGTHYNGPFSGSVYVIFGKEVWGGVVNLSTYDNASIEGFRLDGSEQEKFGSFVDAAGDFNGDGYGDLVIGAASADHNGEDSGSIYVLYGHSELDPFPQNLLSLNRVVGLRVDGESEGDFFGGSVSGVGDYNQDGFDDVIAGSSTGYSYLIPGGNLWDTPRTAVSIRDRYEGIKFKSYDNQHKVNSVGDFNGDGFSDVMIGSPDSGQYSGSIYIIKGEDRTNAYTQEWLIKGIGALKFDGVATDDQSGWSTSSAGDFNGDGIDDVIIGAPFVDTSDTVLSDAGASYIVFGKEGWWEDDFGWDFSMLDGDNGFRLDGVAAGNESGRVVSSAGDVNGDGFDDLILGASQVSYSGEYSLEGSSYIVFGGRNGWNEASHIGSKYSDTLIGTNSADQLISGMGADELIGNGGSDVFYGGPGDDLIRVGDEEFFKIDGGGGSDTLVMPFSLDLLNEYVEDGFGGSKRYIKKIQNIEKISLEGGGNNVLALGLSNVRSLTESNNMLAIIGDIGDRVKFDGKFTVIDSTGEYCELSLDASDTTRLKIQKEIALLPQVSSIVTMSEDSNVDGLLPLALMCGGDNSTLTYRIVSQPAHGSVSLTDTSSGQYSYKPNANYDGTDSFSIVVNDGSIDSSAVVISVEITAINDVPETSDTSLSLDEDQTAMGTLDASDNDGDVLTYTLVTNPSHGVVVLNSENGVYMYTPESNYTGVDSFTFKVNDSLVDSSTATASIMVNAVNDPPVSRGGSEEERTLFANRDNSIQLPEIDDPDSGQFTYTITQQPIHGVLTGNAPNLTYTPNDGYIGSDSFNWKVSDGSAESDVVTVTLSVVRSYTKIANDGSELPQSAMLGNGPNDWACTRDDDTGYIWEVKSDDGGLRDRDHTYSWYSENEQINGGEVGIQNSGSCAASNCDTDGYVSAINEQELCGFTDWRVPGVSELKELVYCGNDVSYPLSDAEGCGSGALLPSIRQDFFPSAPEAAAWSLLTDYSNTNRAWLVDFSSGSLSTELKGGNGYVRLVNGQRALNAAPVISPIGDQITNEDVGSEVTFTIADAESGPDLLLLGVSSSNTSLVSNGNITIAEAGANRTVTLQPSENQYGTTEITLILSDGIELSAEYFTLSVLSVNDIPDATDQSIQVEANSDASGTLKTIDIDGDPLSYAIVISPAHGKVTLDEANTGEYVYTPNEHFFGSDLFTFKASDGSGNSNVATVFITISGESSNAPLASDAVLVVGMNRTIIGNLSGTDPDGDTLSYSITTQPNHGIVTITDVETGLYQYAPFEDYTGSDSFRYKTSDSLYDSNIAVVSISVNSTPTVFNKSATFSSATNSWSGGSGGSVVYTGNPVDIDGDGDIDFIAAFESFHKVVWYENDGYGNFDAHLIATVDKSIYVTSVYAEDVDGDGDMDVISPYSSSELAWYENDGNGRFSIHVIPSIEGRPGNVHADDVDSDGDVDLLSGLSWYENDGNENFIGHTITTETGYGSLIYAADIDGDDDMDLLTASSADDKIAWFENNGSEIFIAHTITTSADNVRSVHVNDLDGDGDMDILSASMSDNKIAWYENDGSESFSTHIVTQSLKYARNVFSVDVDLDGDMDIVTGSSDPNGIAWFENDGDENFSSQNVNTSNFSVYRGFRGFVADADGDGDLDLFSAQSKIWYENLKEVTYSEGHGPVTLNDSLMLSGGAGNSISSATIQLGSGFLAGQEILIFSDSETIIGNWNSTTGTLSLTGNDTVENYKTALHSIQYQNNSIFYENSTRLVTIAVSDSGLTSTPLIMRLNLTKENYAPTAHDDSLSVQLNRFYEGFLSGTDSDGNNITYSIVTPPSHGSVVIADAALGTYLYTPDFNFSGNDSFSFKANDGVSDSNTAEVSIMVSDLPVLSNIATGGFSMIEVSPFWTASTYASTYASDIDSDGDMDLITVSNNEVAWYENDGYENFSLHVVSTAVSSYTSVYATDIDGDSDIDLLSASYSNDEVAWYENDGNENFTTHIISTSANGVKSVYAIDVDGDDDIDLLSASILDDEIVWYKNDGSEQFTTHIVATDADGAQSVHAVDVDGDGDIDLLSASENDRKVAWYENDGSENFTARIVSDNAYGVRSIYAVDMDTDGDVDLVSYSYYGMKIVWYENDGNENFTDHIVSSGQYFSSVYASDLDNDGDIDLLSGSGSPRYILWHENDGNENFTDHILDESLSAASVYAVDVDGDGSMDIFTSGGKVRWYKNQGRLNYNDGDGNVVLNQSISINSSRDYLDSATIKFDSGYVSGLDKLSFSDTSTITGEWNESIGVMTLTGNDTIENYQIALRSVKYININDDPNILKRVLSIAVADSTGESTPLTMQINISAVNDSPIVSDAAISTQVGQDVSSTLIGLDPEGDSLTYSVVTPPSHGSVSIINEATGLYHYMPTNGYDGLDSFTFKLNDGLLDSAVGTVLITVHKMPILLDRSATTFSNRAKLLALSDKDSSSTYTVDVDGDGDLDHLYASFFDSKIGWEENDGNGDYTFHSIANADQTTSILSSDLDSDGDLDIITAVYFGDTSRNVWYENNGNNQFTPHVFTSMILNYLTSIFASDIDNDGDIDLLTASDLNYLIWHKNDGNETFTYHQVYNSTKGITSVFAVDLDGDHDVDLLAASALDNKIAWYENDGNEDFYNSNVEHIVTTEAYYTSSLYAADVDNDGDVDIITSSSSEGVFWYENDGSGTFVAHTVTTSAQSAYSIFLMDVDSDGDLDILSESSSGERDIWYENKMHMLQYMDGAGAVTLNNALTLVKASIANLTGATVQFTNGFSADQDELLFTDTATITGVWNDSSGTLTLSGIDTIEHYEQALRSIQYQNNKDAPDTSDRTLSIVVADGSVFSNYLSMKIEITAINDAPVVNNDTLSTQEDADAGSILNGVDPEGDVLSYSIVTPPEHGTLLLLNAKLGTYRYSPNTDYTGSDSFTFKANDGDVESNLATVTITVTPVNDLPAVNNSALSGSEDQSLVLNETKFIPSYVDTEGDPLAKVRIVSLPASGLLRMGAGTVTVGMEITVDDLDQLIYEPEADWFGTVSFKWDGSDGKEYSKISAVMTINLGESNDSPTGTGTTLTTGEDISVDGQVTAIDPEGDPLNFVSAVSPSYGVLVLATNGTFTYTPENNYNGTDTFIIRASDGKGGEVDLKASVTITPVNDLPSMSRNRGKTLQDGGTITLSNDDLLAIDPESDGVVRYHITSEPINGTIVMDGAPIGIGGGFTQEDINLGRLAYHHDVAGTNSDSFSFKLEDDQGGEVTIIHTFLINIEVVNNAPVAVAETWTTDEDTPISVILQGSDEDGDNIIYELFGLSSLGKADLLDETIGSVRFTPDLNVTGHSSFRYRLYDGEKYSETVQITVIVNPLNDPPIAEGSVFSTFRGTAVQGNLIASDVDQDVLKYSVGTFPTRGILQLDESSGEFVYTPYEGFEGPDSFTFQASDGKATSEHVVVTVVVAGDPSLPPVVNAMEFSLLEDEEFNGQLLGSDPEEDPLSFKIVGYAQHGWVGIENAGTGAFRYTPKDDYHGLDLFSYVAHDGNSESKAAVVELTVIPVNDAPTISGDPAAIANLNEFYQFTPQISDDDGDLLTIRIENLPQWASFNEKTGAITGTPTQQDLGSYSDIRISVADQAEQVTLSPFRISVLGDAPVVTNSPEQGSYKKNQSVSLTCHTTTDAACDIYYTLDGSTPTASSTRYITPIQIEQDSVLKFRGISAGSPDGDVVMAIYNIDTIPPTVEIQAPLEDQALDLFTAVSGVAADIALDQVELQITDGTLYLAEQEGVETLIFTPKESWVTATLNTQDGSWHYATDGVEWPGGTYSITARAVDLAGNQSSDSAIFHYKLPGTQAYTRLSMELSTSAIKLDGVLDITGKLTRLPETTMSLAGREITLNVTQPDGNSIQHHTKTNDEQGHYQFSNIDNFSQKGRYQIEVTFTETPSLTASTNSSPLLVGVNAGYAVLVQGRIDSREGLESHNLTANRIYSQLLNRGLLPENIRYFNFDTSQSGVDAIPTVEGIREAIEVWPREKMNGSPAPLTVVMVDHGDAETFFVDGESQVITPETLDRWFDTLERYLSEEAAAESRNIVLGSCYSGSFIPALSSPGRVVITSASADEVSYKGPKEWDEATNSPIRVGEFFLEELFKKLGKGKTVRKSFIDATRKTEIFTRRGGLSTNSSSRFLDQAVQHPLLDDNGDGEGSNELDLGSDGSIASQLYLGTAGGVTGEEGASTEVEFSALTETLYLSSQQSSAQLWSQSEDDSQVASAWVEVRAPSKRLEQLTGTGQVANELSRELAQLNGDRGRWEVNYDSFSESGKYEIYYFLRDTEHGGVSPLRRSVVYKNRKGNLAPEPFALLGPSYGEKRNTVLRFDWEDAADPEEEPVSYNLVVAKDRYFRQIVWRAEELISSSAAIDESAALDDLSSYFWRVEAVDPYGAMATSSATGYFYTDNTQGVPGIVQGTLYDQNSFDRLSGATIQYPGINGLEQVVSDLDGSYQLIAEASDQVVLEISAGGYDKRSVTVSDMVSGEVVQHSYGLSAGPLAAVDMTIEVGEDQLLDITLGHSGSGYAEPLSHTVIQPEHGTVSVVDAATGQVQYQPASDYSGEDRFTFTINDGTHHSNEAEVLITVHPVNDAPVLDGSGTLSYLELDQGESNNHGVSIIEILGDALTDPDGISLEGMAITGIGTGAGDLQFTQDGGGIWNNVAGADTTHPLLLAADPDIRLRFAPESSFVGETIVTFHGWDRSVGTSGEVVINVLSYSETGPLSEASAQMHIDVVAANQPPVANPVTTHTYEDITFDGEMSATDADGDQLTYTIVDAPSRGKLRQLRNTESGFIYTPAADFYGDDQFTYQVSDGRDVSNIATVMIDVGAVNDVPVAIGDDNLSTYINTSIDLNLRGEDVEGDPLTFSIVTHPMNGALSQQDGRWNYQPNTDWSGLDLLTFEVSDSLATSKAVQVVIEVLPEPNIPPVAESGLSFSTEEEVPFTGKLQGSDQNGDTIRFQLMANGQKGGVEITNGGSGEFIYTPHLNSNGADQFYFKVYDGEDYSALSSVEVQITAVNDPPVVSGTPSMIAKPGEQYWFQPQVDNVDEDSISFSIKNRPEWASFNTGTGALSGNPTVDDAGVTRAVTITASDGELSDSLPPFDLLTLADTSKPWTIASLSEGAYKTTQQVSLHCFDSAGGSCSIYYTTDGTTPTQNSSLYSASIVITEDTQLSYFAVDGEGNAEEIRTVLYQIDASAPSVEITSPIDGLSVDQIFWISGSASDLGSGVAMVELQLTDGLFYLTKSGLQPGASWVEATIDKQGGWIYNTTGIPWVTGNQYSVTARATDLAGNVTTSAILFGYANNNLVQAFSDLTLEVPSQSILQDEKLRVTGKLTRLPETRMSLAGRKIRLSVTNGQGLETARYTTESYDAHGHYTFDQVSGFPSKGEYTVTVTFDETNLIAGSEARVDLQVNSSAGYVVLVEGQTATGSVDDTANRTTNRIYQTLLARGFHAEDIYLLSPQSGQAGVDGAISSATLQSTLQSWVPQNLNAAPAPLYIILLPAGEQGSLLLDGPESVLTPEALVSDLNVMERALSTVARAEKRIVMVGGDNGGSWIPTLSASGRTIVASSSAGERAFLGPLEPRENGAGVEGRDLFLEELMMEWGGGRALKQAFTVATEKVEQLTRRDHSGDRINRFFDNALQHPLLDDNGDGKGSNFLVKQGDGANSGDLYLGVGRGTLALSAPTGITATQFLGEEQQSARIYVEVNRDNPELPTWLALRSPSHTLKGDNNRPGFETLSFSEKDDQGRWMLNLEQLDERGQYELFYYQGDPSSEVRSPSARSLLYRNRRGNSPPGAFHLQAPADQTEQQTVLVLDWGDTTDAETDPVSYTLTIAEDADFRTVVYRQEEIVASTTYVGEEAGLEDLTHYYWKIEAVDQYGAVRQSSEVWGFTTNNTNGVPGIVQGIVFSNSDFSRIGGATLSLGGTSITTEVDGSFLASLLPGSYTPTVENSSTENLSLGSIQVAANETVSFNVSMEVNRLVAYDSSRSVDEDQIVEGIFDADLPDGFVGDFVIDQQPANGTVTILDARVGSYRYQPNDNVTGIDSFTFAASADDGAISNSAAVSIRIGAVNDAPAINGQPHQQVLQGGTYRFLPEIIDVDPSDTLEITVKNLPSWATFHADTGEISGIPENRHVGHYPEILISVNDGMESVQLPPFTIEVSNINDAPTISGQPSQKVLQGGTYQFLPEIIDVDPNDTLTITVENLPSWATFNADAGEISGIPENRHVGHYPEIRISVNDGVENVQLPPFTIEVSNINDAPTISGQPSQKVLQGGTYRFLPEIIDIDPNDILTVTVKNLPSWATFNADTGEISGIPGNRHVGHYPEILISVNDGVETVSLPSFTIEVSNANDAPTISGQPSQKVLQGGIYRFLPEIIDVDPSDTLTITVENLPSWATLNADTGEISGIPENRHVGHYPEILISVSDGIETVSLPSFTIEVSNANDAPTISGQPAQKVLQGETYRFLPDIIDVDPSDTLTITVENLPPWATLNADTGEISGIPENRHVGHYPEILISVNDGVENVQLASFTIEVISTNEAPTIKGNPGTVAVDGLMYSFTPMGSDNDGDTLSYSATNLPEWINLDQATGMISGTPAINDIGRTYSDILLIISDGQESVSLSPFAIEVKDASRISSALNPVLSSPSELAVKSGRTYITLSWNDSSLDALGYRIYRFNAAGTEIEKTFYADPGANSITDTGLTPETSYNYYVSVFNQDGGSAPATISGTTTNASSTILQLHGGWNLIHLPQQTSVSEIKRLVTEVESIWGFVNCSKGWEYTLYEKDSNQTVVGSEITNLEPGRGYWVSLSGIEKNEWVDVEIDGVALTTPITIDNLTLYSGWNSVGVSIPVIISETELPEQIAAIWGWEKYWVSHVDGVPIFLNSLQSLDQNKGYFVYSDAASSGAARCENAQ